MLATTPYRKLDSVCFRFSFINSGLALMVFVRARVWFYKTQPIALYLRRLV